MTDDRNKADGNVTDEWLRSTGNEALADAAANGAMTYEEAFAAALKIAPAEVETSPCSTEGE